MNFLTLLRPLVRWFNLWPLWRAGRVKVWGCRLRAPTFDRWLYLWLHRAGLMGRVDRAFLQEHLQPGMTVVDVGANQGLYSLLFSRRVGGHGRVLAFEPDDLLHAALEENLRHNHADNVKAYHLALGSAAGTMTLYRSLINSGDNRLTRGSRKDGSRQPVQVRVARLDEILAGERVDFVKLDVQGWEMEAFRGMERLLDDPRRTRMTIYFEFWPRGLQDAGSDPLEPLTFLAGRGFTLFTVERARLTPIRDLPALVRQTRAGTYRNLLALRS